MTVVLTGMFFSISLPDHTQLLSSTNYDWWHYCFQQCHRVCNDLQNYAIKSVFEICYDNRKGSPISDPNLHPEGLPNFLILSGKLACPLFSIYLQRIFQFCPSSLSPTFPLFLRMSLGFNFHTLLQMKSVPLERDKELYLLWPASPPGQSLSHDSSVWSRDSAMHSGPKIEGVFGKWEWVQQT